MKKGCTAAKRSCKV